LGSQPPPGYWGGNKVLFLRNETLPLIVVVAGSQTDAYDQ